MNTTAIELPAGRRIHFDRIRGLYNGFGYMLAVSLLLDLWWTTESSLPSLLSGDLQAFGRHFLLGAYLMLVAMIPGVLLVPIVVNCAP